MPFKYDTPTPAGNNRMEYNHIYDNPGAPGGIYLDEGSGFIEVTGNVVYNVRTPMNYNNRNQNRIATCDEHDNFFGIRPGGPPRASGKKIIDRAGLMPEYRDVLSGVGEDRH